MTAPTYTPTPKPTPDATAWMVATVTADDWPDHSVRTVHRWDGYTSADMRDHWAKRAKAARWAHTWDGDTLTVRSPHRGVTETRTFHDQEPTP